MTAASVTQGMCPLCHGDGRCLTECCSGAYGCPCSGQVLDLGPCHGCNGYGVGEAPVDLDANLRAIRSACTPDGFIHPMAYSAPTGESQ